MNFRTVFGCMAAMLLVCSGASAQVLDDNANMKILKARAKLLHINKNELGKQTTDKLNKGNISGSSKCGSVDIGNQSVSSGFGNDIEIIITGDIINTNNHCVDLNQ